MKERISVYVMFDKNFTEDLYNHAMGWCKSNCVGLPRDHDDTYKGLQEHKYFLFDNWGLNSQEFIQKTAQYGVDNNRQNCKVELSVDEFKKLTGYNIETNYEIYY